MSSIRVQYAQLPPAEDSADRLFITDNAVIVLDGASAFAPVPVSAQVYADHLGRAVVDQLVADPGIDLRDAVAGAISRTASTLDLTREASPSSTVSILRATSAGFDVFVLGDSPVLWGNDEEWGALSDDRMDRLALPQRDEYRARLRAGHGFDDEHRVCLRSLQRAQAQCRNVEGGYWIAGADPAAARNALVTTVPATDVEWALLLTDGAFNLLEHQGRKGWLDIARYDMDQLAGLLARLHEWEDTRDPDGRHHPRSKLHDDKTVASVSLSPARRLDS